MSKKLEIIGKVAKFTMSLKGGKLPDGFETEIKVEMNFEGASMEDLYKCCASGQSARVALQSQLRAKTVSELMGLGQNGLKVKFTDIVAGNVSRPADRIMALSFDDFIDVMMNDFEMTEEQATTLYNKKHGIVEEDEQE